ncbi:TerB family tellurite resistance protein [Glaciecola sp. 1036]|uniref:tellurite resistance TerB family protein n=1 Tax=Alteromonadaceae TaxID=72275 RepID=UPI003CFC5748
MLGKFKKFFETNDNDDQKSQAEKLHEACAILLLEVSKADYEETSEETQKVRELLKRNFDLTEEKLTDLIQNSRETEATSVHPFTALINEHYEYEQRVALVDKLWAVAYVDGELSKYEEALIRKVADLLYIRHSDYIKSKLANAS